MYKQMTEQVLITVEPVFLDDQSNPEDNHYVWAYHVWIENNRNDPIQLMSRHWRITDANGLIQEVEGLGVIGEQPLIDPHECYQYTSGTPLATPSGIMEGQYAMQNSHGDLFNVKIPIFSLDSPYGHMTLN